MKSHSKIVLARMLANDRIVDFFPLFGDPLRMHWKFPEIAVTAWWINL